MIYLGGFDILWLNPKSNRAFVGHWCSPSSLCFRLLLPDPADIPWLWLDATNIIIILDPRQGRKFGSFCLLASFEFFGSFCLVLSFSAASWLFLPRSHFNFLSCCMYKCRDFCIVRVEHRSGWQDQLSRDTRPMWSSSCQHPKPKRKWTWQFKMEGNLLRGKA